MFIGYFTYLFWQWSRAYCVYKRAISPLINGEIAREEVVTPLGFLSKLLDVGRLLHIHLVAVLVIEVIFKVG